MEATVLILVLNPNFIKINCIQPHINSQQSNMSNLFVPLRAELATGYIVFLYSQI